MNDPIEKKYPAIYLLRPAQLGLNNKNSRIDGWKDTSLNKLEKEETKKIASTFSSTSIYRIYSSELSQARDTAKEIIQVTGASLVIMRDLRSWNIGDLYDTIDFAGTGVLKEYVKGDTHRSIKNGESFYSFNIRAVDAINIILDEFELLKKNIVIVSNYQFIKLIQAWILAGSVDYKIDADLFMKDDIPPGKIFTITLDK